MFVESQVENAEEVYTCPHAYLQGLVMVLVSREGVPPFLYSLTPFSIFFSPIHFSSSRLFISSSAAILSFSFRRFFSFSPFLRCRVSIDEKHEPIYGIRKAVFLSLFLFPPPPYSHKKTMTLHSPVHNSCHRKIGTENSVLMIISCVRFIDL